MRDAPPALAFHTVPAAAFVYRLAGRLAELTGFRRYGLASLLGALAAAALPPVDLVPLLVGAFTGLLWLADGNRTTRGAFVLGWCFGFGYFLAGLYWIAIALLVDAARFWWLLPFAAAGLPAFFAIYSGLALAAVHLARRRGAARILVFALAWTAAEYLRGWLLTGFPWNLVGYAWAGGFPGAGAVLQTTSLWGVHGLGLLTVLAAALPAAFADPYLGRWRLGHFASVGAALVLVAAMAGFGAVRLAGADSAMVPGVQLRIVQPAIPQTLKWDPDAAQGNFRRHLALSAMPSTPAVTAVIWPEAAVPYILNRDPVAREWIASVVPPGGVLITGGPRAEPPPPAPFTQIWNSLYAIDDKGGIVATYDKSHLVPFGEYVPLRGILPISKITPGMMDFSAGPGPRTLELPHLPPVSPMICYEGVFAHHVVDEAHRPDWMLNVTNDAWYGFSSGPFQHFAITRTRAVEEGLPLVRAANNGISAVIDPYGRIISRLGLDDVGVVDAPLPRSIPATLYARWGDWTVLGMGLALGLLVIPRRRGA
jgi:apolipoprotein N-acyltransferase